MNEKLYLHINTVNILQYLSNCFLYVRGNISRSLTTNRACRVGAMTESNIRGADRKNSCYCIYCVDVLKTYQRETITLLQWFSLLPFNYLYKQSYEATIFLEHRLFQKISARRQGLIRQWKGSISSTNVFIMVS